MADDDMANSDSSDDEFYMDIVSLGHKSSDDFHLDDEIYNNENIYNDSYSGSEFSPQPKRKRPSRPLSSSDEDTEKGPGPSNIGNKIEDSLFGTWYDVSNNDLPTLSIPFTTGTQPPGPKVPGGIEEPIDFFKLFLTDELISNIVEETNKYALTKISKTKLRPRSTWRSWKPVTVDELNAFIGVILNIGLLPVKNLQDCWTREFNLHIPFYGKIFRRERFFQIFWNIHLNENIPNPNLRTRVLKVDNFLKYIENKFQKHYIPNKDISIDEAVIKFKGKISFITYNKNKPTKWGIRMYLLTDATNAYVYSILPYYGSLTTENLIRPELPASSRIVMHLYSRLLHNLPNAKGYHVFCDRYYSSVPLANELLKINCNFTGTINRNRKFIPKFIKNPKFENTNKVVACRANNILLLAWHDKNIVTTISTANTSSSCLVKRKNYDGTEKILSKPHVIVSYTKYMRGVDRADQLASSYCFLRKSLKWWRKLFFWGIEMCSVNAYVLYKTTMLKNNKIPMPHFKFVSELVKQLVGNFRQGSLSSGRPSTTDDEERLNGKPHYNMRINNKKSKDCMVCSNRNIKGERHETYFFCETCTRKPGLHPGECFKRYHTLKDYKI
mgnify:FL=1